MCGCGNWLVFIGQVIGRWLDGLILLVSSVVMFLLLWMFGYQVCRMDGICCSYGSLIGLLVFSIIMVFGLVLVMLVISVFWLLGSCMCGRLIDLADYCVVKMMVMLVVVVVCVVVVILCLLIQLICVFGCFVCRVFSGEDGWKIIGFGQVVGSMFGMVLVLCVVQFIIDELLLLIMFLLVWLLMIMMCCMFLFSGSRLLVLCSSMLFFFMVCCVVRKLVLLLIGWCCGGRLKLLCVNMVCRMWVIMLFRCVCGIMLLVMVRCSGLLKYIVLLNILLVDCWFRLVRVVLELLCMLFQLDIMKLGNFYFCLSIWFIRQLCLQLQMLLMWLQEYIIELGLFVFSVILKVSRFDLCIVCLLILVLWKLCEVFMLLSVKCFIVEMICWFCMLWIDLLIRWLVSSGFLLVYLKLWLLCGLCCRLMLLVSRMLKCCCQVLWFIVVLLVKVICGFQFEVVDGLDGMVVVWLFLCRLFGLVMLMLVLADCCVGMFRCGMLGMKLAELIVFFGSGLLFLFSLKQLCSIWNFLLMVICVMSSVV